jgi:hypothetical protein
LVFVSKNGRIILLTSSELNSVTLEYLPVPPGYGEAGVGKAVFSVSAFMDVIGYKERA